MLILESIYYNSSLNQTSLKVVGALQYGTDYSDLQAYIFHNEI